MPRPEVHEQQEALRRLRAPRYVMRLMEGEQVMACGDGFVIAHPQHAPCLIWWDDGALFCERIEPNDA